MSLKERPTDCSFGLSFVGISMLNIDKNNFQVSHSLGGQPQLEKIT